MAAEAHEYRESQAMVSMSPEERMKYRLSNQDVSSILVTANDDESDDED
jgi:hypothetical protein